MRHFALLLLVAVFFPGCAAIETSSGAGSFPADADSGGAAGAKAEEKTPQPRRFDDGGPITEAPLEPAELRIQRAGVMKVSCKGKEIRVSREIRKAAMKFDAIVMGFKDTEVNLKMPSSKLDAFIDFLDGQEDIEVDEYDFSAFDRTMEHHSIEEHLERAQATYDKLRELEKSAPSLNELERIGVKLAELEKTLKSLKTSKLDINLRAGRVDVRVIIR